MVKNKITNIIFFALYIVFMITIIFRAQLGVAAPLNELLGYELACEIAMILGIQFLARKEAESDWRLINSNSKLEHGFSAFARIVVLGGMMALFGYIGTMPWYLLILNLGWFLILYSAIFNVKLNLLRDFNVFGYIYRDGKSYYDRFWRWAFRGDGYYGAIAKTIFDWSVLPAIFLFKHFVS